MFFSIMLSRSLLLALLAASCRSQYQVDAELRADMTFNENNERFDVANIIEAQKQAYHDQPAPEEEDWRRSFRSLAEMLKQNRRSYQQAHLKSLRRMDNDFAYHDQMLDENEYVPDQYEKSLNQFKRQHNKSLRKTGNFFFKSGNLEHTDKKPVKAKKPAMKELKNVVLNYLHGGNKVKNGRRMVNSNPEDEILLHYAVPLRLTVKGFLQVPQE